MAAGILGIFSSGKYFSAVDLANGRVVWSHRWLTRYGMNACDPVAHDGRVFITSGYGKGADAPEARASTSPGKSGRRKSCAPNSPPQSGSASSFTESTATRTRASPP